MLTGGILMNVGDMQRKLARWAVQRLEDQNEGLFASRNDLRLHDLYHLLYDVEWLQWAYERVASNQGSRSAGCDGLTIATFQQNLGDRLQELAEDLKTLRFQPHPVRRVYIPKANGKLRPLGIPSIRDRMVQEALRMVLEPIFEVEFYRCSFGFRPNRSTMDALARIASSMTASQRYYWAIEGDIRSYFDTINHEHLMTLLRRRIRDDKLLALVWRFLKAGVMEGKLFKATDQGTPQGGIISPLLANVYLHELQIRR
jgi:RNA-directed DNA polymerase